MDQGNILYDSVPVVLNVRVNTIMHYVVIIGAYRQTCLRQPRNYLFTVNDSSYAKKPITRTTIKIFAKKHVESVMETYAHLSK